MDPQNVNSLHTAKIVGSYLRHHTVGASELPELITSVHHALSGVGSQAPVEEVLTPAVSVRQSVRPDYVVCLDCGYRGKTLRRHINSRHGLNPNEYLKRWGLRSDHPLTAPGYSEKRSIVAKERGFGGKSTQRRLRHQHQWNLPRQMQTGRSRRILNRGGRLARDRSPMS
jgi:predicted transcriptional regulator